MNANQLGEWLRFVPLALLMSAIVMVVRYYSNHKKSYKVITKIVILQALVTVGINIALGMLGMEKSGLLIGNIIGIVITAIASLLIFRGVINVTILEWSKEKVFLAKKYKDFPLYNATTSVLDNLAVALPVFMLTKYYPEAIVGYYALLIRVAQAPLSFISISVSQVHLKKTSDLIKNNQSIIKYLLKITAVLLVIVIFPTIILSSLAPEIFSWVFGETWTMAGQLLAILMPALALRFVVSTVSPLLGATGHNKLSAVWKIGSLIATLTMFVILAPKLEVVEIFVAMLLMDLMLYFIYYLLILYAALKPVGYR